jgi:hypothetical protein
MHTASGHSFVSENRSSTRRTAAFFIALLAACLGVRAQNNDTKKSPPAHERKHGANSPRVLLSPRFVPGQTFRYEMEFETTTEMSRSGLAADPQGPSSVAVDWNAAVRIDVLPADGATPGGIRLRTTYEKSAASVRSDTFDPAATETAGRYHDLEGQTIELTLDAGRNVKSVSGLESLVNSEEAARSAREWVAQLSASAGAPPGGVSISQTWSSEIPADSLPIAGMVWRTDSEYLRNEPCHRSNSEAPTAASEPAAPSPTAPDCAVILANLSLVRTKGGRDATPPELRKDGVQSAGKWSGSAQSLLYVSLDSGIVVSVTQTGAQQMDVVLTSSRHTAMRYAGTISSRSHVALVAGGLASRQ